MYALCQAIICLRFLLSIRVCLIYVCVVLAQTFKLFASKCLALVFPASYKDRTSEPVHSSLHK